MMRWNSVWFLVAGLLGPALWLCRVDFVIGCTFEALVLFTGLFVGLALFLFIAEPVCCVFGADSGFGATAAEVRVWRRASRCL